jgi:Sugar kinases, ribokinase family
MSPAVVGVGNAHLDRTHVVTSIPGPDEGAYALDSHTIVGGVAANVATGLARLGHDTGVIARLGDDADGRQVQKELKRDGLDVERLRLVADEASSYTLVLRTPDGQRAIVGGGESSLRLRLRAPDTAYLGGATVAVTSGYTPAIVLQALLDRTIDPRPAVVVDLAGTMDELRARGYTEAVLDRLLPRAALVVGSASAVASYAGTDTATVAALRDRGVDQGAITRGADGAQLWNSETVVDLPAFDVTVADTTGAGDAFTAGLIDGLVCRDCRLRAAGEFAAAAAALNCTTVGARPGLPTRKAVEAFLRAQ